MPTRLAHRVLRLVALLSTVICGAALLPSSAWAEVITTNLADPADGGSFVNSTFPQRAQAFSTTATGTQISAVTLDVSSSTLAQPFSIKVYSTGTSGLPDTSVATIFSGTGGDVIFGASPFTVSGLNLNLAPSTQYFMVFQHGGSFSGQWNYNLETSGSGGGFLVDNSLSQTTVDNWQGISNAQPYRMEVVAVPEPPAIVMAGIGIASAIWSLQRRRKSA